MEHVEEALLTRAKAGDQGAFADLVGLHKARMWSVCLRIAGNHADAEDALQDALTAMWQNLDRYRGEARFGTWVHRIAANATLAIVRRRKDMPTDIIRDADPVRDLSDHVVEADRIQTALLKLPENFRVTLVLREYGDLSYEDIAVHQGIPVQTVRSRLNRARRMLSDALNTVEH
ncbi:RNA polymerase sigma factor [Rhodococcus aetherivorans]|uniref:RNA polymerase sigma factor n=1 Tax=Rhodococcus aetherivorans TaxID=191292 RepID=UPI00366F3F70